MDVNTLKDYELRGLLYSQKHPTLPLFIWNYTDKAQWDNLWDEITLQCRGLVTDDLGNVVARPFKKFFNLSENRTNTSDNFEIFEKLDGSLGILFFYGENWILASRGSFTSEQAIKGKEILDINCEYNKLRKDYTYCFEIIYPENKIVVEYNGLESCILTAVFNTTTGQEKSIKRWGIPWVKSFNNVYLPKEKLHLNIKDTEEGYVLKFCNGERCKIKGAEYLRLHKMMSEMSTTAVWDCLRNGDSILKLIHDFPDEFYNIVRDYERELSKKFYNEKIKINSEYLVISESLRFCDDKTFALFINGNPYKSYLFSLRSSKDITKQIWNNLKPEYRRL
jgi:hypothetical protein